MEWLTIILASFLSILTPSGFIVDNLIENALRQQVKQVETLEVRVDNVPSYQALSGKIDRIRLASRGVEPIAGVRIDTLEVETDPISLDIDYLRRNKDKFREALRQPLQGAGKIIITEADINRALASDSIKDRLQKLLNRTLPEDAPKFTLLSAKISLVNPDHLQAEIQLQQGEGKNAETLNLMLSSGVKVIAGRSLELFDSQATLNGRKLSSRILKGFTDRINESLDLRSQEKRGIWIRLLQLKIGGGTLEVAGFARINPLPVTAPSEPSR